MEKDQNRNYNRDENNYNIRNDRSHEDDENGQRAEEFTNDQPNHYNDQDRNINTPEIEEENRKANKNQENNSDRYFNEDERRRNPLRRYQNL